MTGFQFRRQILWQDKKRKSKKIRLLHSLRSERTINWIRMFKRWGSCEECKGCTNLTFHHMKGHRKLFNIGDPQFYRWLPLWRVIEEVEKCELICRDCHDKHHPNHPEVIKRRQMKGEVGETETHLPGLVCADPGRAGLVSV